MSAFEEDLDRSPLGERGLTVLPASQFLQERLQERRARNMRPKRSRHTDFGPRKGRDDDIFFTEAQEGRNTRMFDSSPLAPGSTRGSDGGRGPQNSDRRRRALGVRDMDAELDRLSKENFALKLELDHRREKERRLQQQLDSASDLVERAATLESEHKELLRINSELVQELEKRDKAVEEAMDIICDLEERVNDIDERGSNTRPSTANADSGYAGTETQEQEPPASPPKSPNPTKTPNVNVRPPTANASAASEKLQGLLTGPTPAKPRREPSVLSSKKPSTQALRTVYMENTRSLRPVQSFQSLLSKQDGRTDDDDEASSSPRLSVLSESSFPSIYSPKEQQLSPDRYAWEEDDDARSASIGSRPHNRQDSIKRVSQWIDQHDAPEATPSKSNNISEPMSDDAARSLPPRVPRHGTPQHHYQSLNDALAAVAKPTNALESAAELRQYEPHLRKRKTKQPRPTSFAGPIFSEALLPPTPDSASTRMLRASRSSMATDRSLLDTTPAVVKGYDALEPGTRTAPRQMRSSVELKSAYASNLNHRNNQFDGLRAGQSSDEEDAEHDADARSETVKGFGLDFDEFPDGKSIDMGTPRRLLQQSRQGPPADIMFNRHDMSPIRQMRSPPRRRRSSEDPVSNPAKPRLTRVETSPTIFGALGRMVSGGGKSSAESVISPHSTHSQHSGSSGNRTVVQGDERSNRTLSPDGPRRPSISVASSPRARASPSPARALSKKTQKLFRRFSNSQGSDREKTLLPTLTSTPSSAYVNNYPTRPKTSHADRSPTSSGGTLVPRPPSSREANRPGLQTRTKTEPATGRPASAAGTDKDKRTLFTRANSVKNAQKQAPDAPDRGGPPKRRGSLRDAVAARRPWR